MADETQESHRKSHNPVMDAVEFSKKNFFPLAIFFAVLLLIAGLLFIRRESLFRILDLAKGISPEQFRGFIMSFGLFAPIVFIAIDVFQSVFSIIPYSVTAMSGGLLFGPFLGSIMSFGAT